MVIYQPVFFGSGTFWECKTVYDFSYPAHMHRCMEWIYVIRGIVEVLYGEKIYQVHQGQSVLYLPNVIHSFQSSPNSEWVYLCFSPELVPAFGKQTEQLEPICPVFQTEEALVPLLLTLREDHCASTLRVKGLLYLLCSDFFSKTQWVSALKNPPSLLYKVLIFAQEHFQEEISLHTLSQEVGYDYYYLSRYLKKNLHLPFSQYLTQYRITYACSLLRERDYTITEVARLSGYSCIRSFNDAFKKITGMTPRSYRSCKTGSEPALL